MAGLDKNSEAVVRAAANGDHQALALLLSQLGAEGTGSTLLLALLECPDNRLWTRMLEFCASNRQTGAGTAATNAQTERARNTIMVAFSIPQGAASADARQKVLSVALSSADANVRALAAELLGQRGDPSALDALVPMLADPDDHVRASTVRALAQMQSQRAIPFLLRALERFDVVASEAVNGLIQVGAPAVAPLLDELRNGDSWTRWHAAQALGGIRDPRAIAPLLDALQDDDAGVRWQAVNALARFGRDALDPLLHALVLRPVTLWFAEGADRLLRRIATGDLAARAAPLHRALRNLDAAVEAPVEAARLRESLRVTG